MYPIVFFLCFIFVRRNNCHIFVSIRFGFSYIVISGTKNNKNEKGKFWSVFPSFIAWTEGDPVKTVFGKQKLNVLPASRCFCDTCCSHMQLADNNGRKMRCLLDNFAQIVLTSECCVNYCCFSHDFGKKYAGDNNQMNSQRQHFVVNIFRRKRASEKKLTCWSPALHEVASPTWAFLWEKKIYICIYHLAFLSPQNEWVWCFKFRALDGSEYRMWDNGCSMPASVSSFCQP